MFSADAALFFWPPRKEIHPPHRFGILYLLRRDIDRCMGIDPNTGQRACYEAVWPGAMTMLAGVDLLAKFFAGSDDTGKVGERFQNFLKRFSADNSPEDRNVIYQLRNSLLHSFGLYSKRGKKEYRFFLTGLGTGPLVQRQPPDQ